MSPETIRAELMRLMDYDPLTGLFIRKISSSARARKGAIAGNLGPRGYWHICVLGQNFVAHRLAWLYVHGSFPPHRLDHENRVRHDNRLGNLRPATDKQNSENQGMHARNTSGVRGVTWRKDTLKWQAQIQHNGRGIYLGCFPDLEAAKAAREKSASELFTHYSGDHS